MSLKNYICVFPRYQQGSTRRAHSPEHAAQLRLETLGGESSLEQGDILQVMAHTIVRTHKLHSGDFPVRVHQFACGWDGNQWFVIPAP